jgi:hypothetical protein
VADWQLICHHTYAGVPGLVVDVSPDKGSQGTAIGLSDGDFLANGVAPKSGAVNMFKSGARIYVATSQSWQPLGGMRGEVLLRREVPSPGTVPNDFIIDGDTFQFYIRNGVLVAWFSSYPSGFAEISTHLDAVGPPYLVPTGVWTTLGFMHDGICTMELYADGRVVARRLEPLWPINPPGSNGISIGNTRTADSILQGQIDDVKVWRVNPHRVEQNFLNRPMDDGTEACWYRFFQALTAAMAQYPQCAQQIATVLDNAVIKLIQQGVLHDPVTRQRLQYAASQYRTLWTAGQINSPAMAKLIRDVTTWLRLVGLNPGSDPDLVALESSECLKLILAELPSLDCDPAFKAFLGSLS